MNVVFRRHALDQDTTTCPAQRRALLWFFLGGLTKKEPGRRPEPANLLFGC